MTVTDLPRPEWEPGSPTGDTFLCRFITNWTESIEAQGLPAGGESLRQNGFAAVDLGRPSFGGNVVTLIEPLYTDRLEAVMTDLATFYRFEERACTGTVTLFSPWPTPNLTPYGWTLGGYEPLMLRPVGGDSPQTPPGLRIERVKDEIRLHDFEQAMIRGFEMSELEAQPPGAVFPSILLADPRLHLWVGYERDQPVCASATFVSAGINNVTLVGTVPEARRHGYGAALTAQASLADPALPALLLATDDGQPVYERLGYLPLFRFTVWEHDRPAPNSPQ